MTENLFSEILISMVHFVRQRLQKGEITTLLLLIGLSIVTIGIAAGSQLVQKGPQLQSAAQQNCTAEVCDGIDNDCDGLVDEGLPGCVNGCYDNMTKCGGTCVDTSYDSANCGMCANKCSPSHVCTHGVCVAPSPTPPPPTCDIPLIPTLTVPQYGSRTFHVTINKNETAVVVSKVEFTDITSSKLITFNPATIQSPNGNTVQTNVQANTGVSGQSVFEIRATVAGISAPGKAAPTAVCKRQVNFMITEPQPACTV